MSDARRRALQRRAALEPTFENQAAVLRARIRAGEITCERVELAAYLGDEGAQLVAPGTGHQSRLGHLGIFLSDIAEWSREAFVRAAIAMGRWVLSVDGKGDVASSAGSIWGQFYIPSFALEAAEAWVLCPCGVHQKGSNLDAYIKTGLHPEWLYSVDVKPDADYRAAICSALIPWALGVGDSVLDTPRSPRPPVTDADEWLRRHFDSRGVLVSDVDWGEVNATNAQSHAKATAMADVLDAHLFNARRWLPPIRGTPSVRRMNEALGLLRSGWWCAGRRRNGARC